MDEKDRLIAEMDESRRDLWTILAGIEPEYEICPGWNQRDFFAHIAGWEALVFESFRLYLAGKPLDIPYQYPGEDAANARFVSERRNLSLLSARLECEISRFGIKTMLLAIPAEKSDDLITFPWTTISALQFIHEAIEHERNHASDILELKQTGQL
ncbi:MAG TPA: ClbS/DfsB family four-helix bundle protein [Phototrophicaceae bacterium]|nr:ClbS/DfsB family four-helix bundle protein [Phototrophicaceae bacterium]